MDTGIANYYHQQHVRAHLCMLMCLWKVRHHAPAILPPPICGVWICCCKQQSRRHPQYHWVVMRSLIFSLMGRIYSKFTHPYPCPYSLDSSLPARGPGKMELGNWWKGKEWTLEGGGKFYGILPLWGTCSPQPPPPHLQEFLTWSSQLYSKQSFANLAYHVVRYILDVYGKATGSDSL